jgi:hypothetical protein
MKLLIGWAAIVGLSAVSAMAGEGRLSNQSLAKIGLVGMKIMSDSQGLEIRGLGVADGSGYGGDKDHHHKGEGNKHHEKHHEKPHEECGHHHESSCHPSCHVESLCNHVHCGGRAG